MTAGMRAALLTATCAVMLALAPTGDAQEQEQRGAVSVVEPRVVAPVVVDSTVVVPIALRVRRGFRAQDVRVALRDVVPEPGGAEVRPGGVVLLPTDGGFARKLGTRSRVRVQFDTTLVRPGSYVLTFDAWRVRRRAAARQFTVTVGLPAPVLRPTQPLHVERVLGWGGDKVQPLTVRETTSRSRVTVADIRQVNESSEAGVVAGELEFKDFDSSIRPGGVLRIEASATEGFPVGTSNGTLEVETAELDTPVAVPFVVETRLSRAWLALALFLGLVAGGVARYYLQRRITLGEAQLGLDSLRGRIIVARRLHPDGPFRKDTDAILEEIDRLLEEESDASRLQSALSTQEEALSQALAGLDDRRTRLKPEIERRAAALAVTRSLPGVVRRELGAVQQLVALASEHFGVDAIDKAEERLDGADAAFLNRVLGETGHWRDDLKAFTDAVRRAQELVGEAVEAASHAAELADTAAEGSAKDWNAALEAIAAAHAAANALRDRVGRAAQARLAEVARQRTDETHAVAAPQLEALEQSLRELIAALEAATGSVRDAYKRAADALDACAVVGQRTRMPETPGPPMTVGISSAAFDTGASGWTSPLLFGRDGGDGGDRRAWRRGVTRGVRAARYVQWVIIALVVFVIGYELFENDFRGTVEQLVLAFLWAFTADVSLNGVVAVAQQRSATAQPQSPAA